MELRNLKTFAKVAEIGNFSRAAQELGYAQSTVTMQIQALEQELQATLFERHGKRITLSAAGEEFREYAYEMLRQEKSAIDHFQKDSEPSGYIRVGVMETMCASRYGEIFKGFLKKYPKVKLKIIVAKTLDCMAMLEKGELDVILTVDKRLNRSNWEVFHAIETEICFFCSAEHPFAGRGQVSVEELILENFIQIEEGCNYRQAFEQHLADQRKWVNNIQEVGYTSMIIDSVADNLGVSLLPRFTLEKALAEGRISVFGVADYSTSMLMQVVYDRNRWATRALRVFMNYAKEVLI